ncbi:hypothetical protein Fmac_026516 [Flemingia macrophylla]|uniref:Uncharacterized protein n=1 Tax=Flemingia macrophylla TaxID=520843 RepID=A0ABD1LF26_9FABA
MPRKPRNHKWNPLEYTWSLHEYWNCPDGEEAGRLTPKTIDANTVINMRMIARVGDTYASESALDLKDLMAEAAQEIPVHLRMEQMSLHQDRFHDWMRRRFPSPPRSPESDIPRPRGSHLKWNGMALLVTLRPGLSPQVRSFGPATQEVGFANTTTLGLSPSFYGVAPDSRQSRFGILAATLLSTGYELNESPFWDYPLSCKANFCGFPSLQRGFCLATFTISEIFVGDLSEI